MISSVRVDRVDSFLYAEQIQEKECQNPLCMGEMVYLLYPVSQETRHFVAFSDFSINSFKCLAQASAVLCIW
jgi:hypothetical protein